MELELELKEAIDGINRSFEAFKTKNDERLAALEKKGSVDPLITEEVKKLQESVKEIQAVKLAIEDVEKKANRLAVAGGKNDNLSADEKAHKAAFEQFLRKGYEAGLKDLEEKTINLGTNADGGFASPIELDRTIYNLIKQISPMRGLCNVVRVGTNGYQKLVNVHGVASGWVGETDARTATANSQLARVTPFMGEIYANPQASQQSLDDIFFDVEAWIADENATEFAKQEGQSFIDGNGTNKPKGFLGYTLAATADSGRAFGTLQYLPTGVAGNWPAANPADILITLKGQLKRELRAGAKFVMNGSLKTEIELFKDSTGNYLWRPSLREGEQETFLGYGVEELPGMPDRAASSLSVAFGNFKAGYTIVDRVGIRTLRDPYTNKPFVGFYSTKRVGGMVVDSEAIKTLKFSVS